VAAFNNHEEAQELINRLQKKGYTAYQITGRAAAKGTLHRVRVGHFQSLQEAKQLALEFEKKEKIKTIITSLQ
jgi:cell division septation protein DedD